MQSESDRPLPTPLGELLTGLPQPCVLSAADVRRARAATTPRTLVVLDDDPTGTQSVGDLPVITSWTEEDLAWALDTGVPAVYVLTNSRCLDPETAAGRNVEVATRVLRVAERMGVEVDFVSRSDSTLRGHYPLEPEVLTRVLVDAGTPVDGVLIVPAFGDAGRVTVRSVHYAGSDATGYVPVGETEFAKDSTFGYVSSDLRRWVEEKSNGRIAAADVAAITLDVVRSGPSAVAEALAKLTGGRPAVVDIVDESDLRVLALALLRAESVGKHFIHRVGPPFVRALLGQEVLEPLAATDIDAIRGRAGTEEARYGLVVVGSHVELATRQLDELQAQRRPVTLEIDVARVLTDDRVEHLTDVASAAVRALQADDVVLHTTRELITGRDVQASLDLAHRVSEAIVEVVRRILAGSPPRFVVAKGGITSADVASRGLAITRAIVRGPMLPGIVSLWEPVDGPARGIPYIVFAGNVGSETSLAEVVGKLTR